MQNVTIEIKGWLGCVIYCVIGLLVDYWLYLPVGIEMTQWNNVMTYAVMVFWPALLMWEFLVIVFYIVVAICIGMGAIILWEHFSDKYRRRKRRAKLTRLSK